MPHGPDQAVMVPVAATIQGPTGAGAGGRVMLAWCPDSLRVMSGSGPFGPIFTGVWQSSQPMAFTRYLPRAMEPPLAAPPAGFMAAGFGGVAAPCPAGPAA